MERIKILKLKSSPYGNGTDGLFDTTRALEDASDIGTASDKINLRITNHKRYIDRIRKTRSTLESYDF
jgi:hypothetical protein